VPVHRDKMLYVRASEDFAFFDSLSKAITQYHVFVLLLNPVLDNLEVLGLETAYSDDWASLDLIRRS
jgi:hypothetical protein